MFRPRQRREPFAEVAALEASKEAPGACPPVVSDKVYRFVEGRDSCLVALGPDELSELNSTFAKTVLREGRFPMSVAEIVARVDEANPELQRESYMVGEGSQVPTTVAPRTASRDLRYVIAWKGADGARVFLSASPGGASGFLQVVSWDDSANHYDFFAVMHQQGDDGGPAAWAWAGDSEMARAADTIGRGCFDCHHNGTVIMKELTAPWNNWQSPRATISPDVVPEAVADEALFQELNGADDLETLVRGGVAAYHGAWMSSRAARGSDGSFTLTDVDRMLSHVFTDTTVNFASSTQPSAGQADIGDVPVDILVWDDILRVLLGLDYTVPELTLKREPYAAWLESHEFALVQDHGEPTWRAPGSTHFALFAPVPSFDDATMVKQLRRWRVVPDKFLAAALLVDVTNPVFSKDRGALQRYADQITTGTISPQGVSTVPEDFARLVQEAASGQPSCDLDDLDACSPEQQFLWLWTMDDASWKDAAAKRVQDWLDTWKDLDDEARVARIMELSTRRRAQFASWPTIGNLDEFSLLLPETQAP